MKYFTIIATMLIGSNAMASDVIAPPITKYVDVQVPVKRPTNFGRDDYNKLENKVQQFNSKIDNHVKLVYTK